MKTDLQGYFPGGPNLKRPNIDQPPQSPAIGSERMLAYMIGPSLSEVARAVEGPIM